MKIAVCTDELYLIHDLCKEELLRMGHQVTCFGALASRKNENWVTVARDAALAIQRGECDEGVFFCYTGTGVSMVANKVAGIRAALVGDSKTAIDARIWNQANVLALSNRLISPDILKEILAAWLSDPDTSLGEADVAALKVVDDEFRRIILK